MTTNANQQPWAPDPDHTPGEAGERGTSTFDGNATFAGDQKPKGSTPAYGPLRGVDYYHAGANPSTPVGTGVSGASVRESAGTHAPLTLALVTTASSLTPAANASVTLTATATTPSDYVPAGTVTFKDGSTTLGTGTFNGSGVATYVKSGGFTAGAHSITSVYAGDADFSAVTSAAITVTAS